MNKSRDVIFTHLLPFTVSISIVILTYRPAFKPDQFHLEIRSFLYSLCHSMT